MASTVGTELNPATVSEVVIMADDGATVMAVAVGIGTEEAMVAVVAADTGTEEVVDQSMGTAVAMEGGQAEADGVLGLLDLCHVEGLALGSTSDRGLVPAMVAIMAAARLVPVLIGVATGPGLARAMVVGAVAALAKEAPAINSVTCRLKRWWKC